MLNEPNAPLNPVLLNDICYSQPPFEVYGLERVREFLLQIEGYETLGDQARRKKAIIELVGFSLQIGLEAGFRPMGDADGNVVNTQKHPIPEYAGGVVAFLMLPKRTEGEHWAFEEIAYFLPKERAWDGHDRPTKLARINEFIDTKWY